MCVCELLCAAGHIQLCDAPPMSHTKDLTRHHGLASKCSQGTMELSLRGKKVASRE